MQLTGWASSAILTPSSVPLQAPYAAATPSKERCYCSTPPCWPVKNATFWIACLEHTFKHHKKLFQSQSLRVCSCCFRHLAAPATEPAHSAGQKARWQFAHLQHVSELAAGLEMHFSNEQSKSTSFWITGSTLKGQKQLAFSFFIYCLLGM